MLYFVPTDYLTISLLTEYLSHHLRAPASVYTSYNHHNLRQAPDTYEACYVCKGKLLCYVPGGIS